VPATAQGGNKGMSPPAWSRGPRRPFALGRVCPDRQAPSFLFRQLSNRQGMVTRPESRPPAHLGSGHSLAGPELIVSSLPLPCTRLAQTGDSFVVGMSPTPTPLFSRTVPFQAFYLGELIPQGAPDAFLCPALWSPQVHSLCLSKEEFLTKGSRGQTQAPWV
jgi:hypothetical protein